MVTPENTIRSIWGRAEAATREKPGRYPEDYPDVEDGYVYTVLVPSPLAELTS